MYTKVYAIKRTGEHQEIIFDKIKHRIEDMCYDLLNIDVNAVTTKVIQRLWPGVTTVEIDTIIADTSATMIIEHTDYERLAARIAISNLHKATDDSFTYVMYRLYTNNLLSAQHYKFIDRNRLLFDATICTKRDFELNYFSIRTMEQSYLMRVNGMIVERPQYMWMRTAIALHLNDTETIVETYNHLSNNLFIYATSTITSLSHWSPPSPSSCYIMSMKGNSIRDIFETVTNCAIITQTNGCISVNVSEIRAAASEKIGRHDDLIPMLHIFNSVVRHIGYSRDDGDFVNNKNVLRQGISSLAVYLEPWHADIFEFLNLSKGQHRDNSNNYAKELLYGLWIPDIFMKRVRDDDYWSLMCPHKSPGLFNEWGFNFDYLYREYERKGAYVRRIKARELWHVIVETQLVTSAPYIMYKDACNRKSNHQHLGTIKCANLCSQIVGYSSSHEISVCNMASIVLPMFVTVDRKLFDFQRLHYITKLVTRNLDRNIDLNRYPVPEAKQSNLRHRPLGIGVQGFAETLIKLRYAYESEEARLLNVHIFETIYHAALEASCELAQTDGIYPTYIGSPVSFGILQFDMWSSATKHHLYNWYNLREKIQQYGIRNSLLIAPVAAATTAHLLGYGCCNSESLEPLISNVCVRRILSDEIYTINDYLMHDLKSLKMWNENIRGQIIQNRGSIQSIACIPENIRAIYKTAWEVPIEAIIDMAADRSIYVDHSQMFNSYIADDAASFNTLNSIHFYAWDKGLKTSIYNLHTNATAKTYSMRL